MNVCLTAGKGSKIRISGNKIKPGVGHRHGNDMLMCGTKQRELRDQQKQQLFSEWHVSGATLCGIPLLSSLYFVQSGIALIHVASAC